MSYTCSASSIAVPCASDNRLTSLTRHAKKRLSERTRLTRREIRALLDAGLYVNIGSEPRNDAEHLLLWSLRDQRFIIAIRNPRTAQVITVLPEQFDSYCALSIPEEAFEKARELACTVSLPPIVRDEPPRFPLVFVKTRIVREHVACPICKAQVGECCQDEWYRPTKAVHAQRLERYEEARESRKQAISESQSFPNWKRLRLKAWRMLPSGEMASTYLGKTSRLCNEIELERFLEEPGFSQAIAQKARDRDILFASIFKVMVCAPHPAKVLRIVEFPRHIECRVALRLQFLTEVEDTLETEFSALDLFIVTDRLQLELHA